MSSVGKREVAEAKKKRLVAVACLMAAKVRWRAASVGLKGGGGGEKEAACDGDVPDGCQGEVGQGGV